MWILAVSGPRREAQVALFYGFSLKVPVPRDQPLRSIDRFLDLSSVEADLGTCSGTSRLIPIPQVSGLQPEKVLRSRAILTIPDRRRLRCDCGCRGHAIKPAS